MYGHKTAPVSVVRRPWAAAVAASAIAVAALFSSAVHAAPQNIDDGSLTWGIKQSFRSYIMGPIAHGQTLLSDGATQAPDNGVFTFVNGSGTYDDATDEVDAAFEGTVHFQGHEGVGVPAGEYALDMKVENVRVQIEGDSGFIVADVSSKSLSSGSVVSYPNVELAALDLTGVTPSVTGNTVSFAGIPATLTAAGVPAFADFYTAGTELDPVSFSITLDEGEDPGEPGDPEAVTQTITTTILESGGLSISVDEDQVTLPTPQLNDGGTALVSSGALNPVTVTDLRLANPGWNANGQVSAFTSATSSFGGEHLGWTPNLVSSSDGQTVTPGASVAPGTGIATSSTLGSADAGEGRGTAVLGADLELEIPTDTEPGEYSATVTLTVI